MTTSVHGIHHVTCIAGSAQENLDFYVSLLGMRLVKKSVNQDAPDTYHLFYADRVGNPGTDFTFFPWPEMGAGRPGTGLTVEVSFAVPPGSLEYWQDRFQASGVEYGIMVAAVSALIVVAAFSIGGKISAAFTTVDTTIPAGT